MMNANLFFRPLPGIVVVLCLIYQGPAWAVKWVGDDLRGRPCHGGGTGVGPYDYRQRDKYGSRYRLVVGAHFKSFIRDLVSSKSGVEGTSPYGDIDYTLRAIPNHHSALHAMMRYFWHPRWRERAKKERTPPECYLQRAIAFAKNDGQVHLLFGIYLHRMGVHNVAEQQYVRSLELNNRIAETHYNYGLLLADLERFDEAKQHAEKAYNLGYPLPGLRRRLAQAGHEL